MEMRRTLFLVALFFVAASLRLIDNIHVLERENVLLKEKLRDVANKRTKTMVTNNVTEADESVSEDSESPVMVLHVGPRKTGTSSIQKFAQAHEDELERNNFYYLGHYGRSYETNLHFLSDFCLQCESNGDCDCEKRWKVFKNTVGEHYAQGHNVLLSDETLNRFFLADQDEVLWDRLVPILQGWRLRIVFTYRHYHSWIPSSYHQSFHPRGSHNREVRQSWPDQGGWIIPSFPEYVSRFSQHASKQPDWAKAKWDAKFPRTVQVFNMHDKGDMISNFFCQMVPEAKAMCRKLTNRGSNFTMNSSANKDVLHFDMLVTTAYQRGFVNKNISRKDVAAAAEVYGSELGMKALSDFPLECLGKEQSDQLLKISLETQSKIVGSSKFEDDLRSDFMEETNRGVFCSIDSNATLEDQRWKQFFKNLNS